MRVHGLVSLAVLLILGAAPAQNSTRKERVPPGPLAQRAGSAVSWRADLTAALAEAKDKGRPVFCYVPTLAGSPMDRKPEIDRYLMAGPFSWPTTVALLNDSFVPVRAVPSGELQRAHELVRGRFIEPGYLVFDGDGKELWRLDRISTLHPEWFEAPLRALAGVPAPVGFGAGPLHAAWSAYRDGDLAGCRKRIDEALAGKPADPVIAEALWLQGASQCRGNDRDAAVASWRRLCETLPEQPLAWKAAMESEGHGPFARGFEDYLPLPEIALRDRPTAGSRAARSSYGEDELWRRGVRFLLAMAEADGRLRDSIYDFGGADSLPNVHAAVTWIGGLALLAAQPRMAELGLGDEVGKRVAARLQQYVEAATDDRWLALRDRDELLWAHIYRLRFLCRWQRQNPEPKLAAAVQAGVDRIAGMQMEDGAWYHEYPNPFAIAAALQALAEARDAGATVAGDIVERGQRALLRCRTEQGAYSYGYSARGKPRASIPGAAGRMPLCELALLGWQGGSQEALRGALAAAFEHHHELAAVQKYDDHASPLGYGGFFFWFDMLGRSEALLRFDDVAERQRLQAVHRKLVLDLAEFDGCFVDSHELGRCYGTAMALLCLDAR